MTRQERNNIEIYAQDLAKSINHYREINDKETVIKIFEQKRVIADFIRTTLCKEADTIFQTTFKIYINA